MLDRCTQTLGLIVFTLPAQHRCQIVHARQRRWMLLPQHLFLPHPTLPLTAPNP